MNNLLEEQYQKIADNTFEKFITLQSGRISLKVLPSKRDLPVIHNVQRDDDKVIRIIISSSNKPHIESSCLKILDHGKDEYVIIMDFNNRSELVSTIDQLISTEKFEISNSPDIPQAISHSFNKRLFDFCKRIANNDKGVINFLDLKTTAI
jgi:hypothetical protein